MANSSQVSQMLSNFYNTKEHYRKKFEQQKQQTNPNTVNVDYSRLGEFPLHAKPFKETYQEVQYPSIGETILKTAALPTTLTKDVLFGMGKGVMNVESVGANLVGNAIAPTAAGFRGAVDGFNENGFGGMVKQGVSNYINEYDYQGRKVADALLNAVGVGSNLAQSKLDSGFDKTRTADAMIFDDAGNTGAGYYRQASNKLNEIDDFYDSQWVKESKQNLAKQTAQIEQSSDSWAGKFWEKVKANASNPLAGISNASDSIGQSLVPAGIFARGSKVAGTLMAGLSEGASAYNDVLNQANAQGLDVADPKVQKHAVNAAIQSGGITIAFGGVANKLGLGDLDTLTRGVLTNTTIRMRAVGLLKELGLEISEESLIAIATNGEANLATGKDYWQGSELALADALTGTLYQKGMMSVPSVIKGVPTSISAVGSKKQDSSNPKTIMDNAVKAISTETDETKKVEHAQTILNTYNNIAKEHFALSKALTIAKEQNDEVNIEIIQSKLDKLAPTYEQVKGLKDVLVQSGDWDTYRKLVPIQPKTDEEQAQNNQEKIDLQSKILATQDEIENTTDDKKKQELLKTLQQQQEEYDTLVSLNNDEDFIKNVDDVEFDKDSILNPVGAEELVRQLTEKGKIQANLDKRVNDVNAQLGEIKPSQITVPSVGNSNPSLVNLNTLTTPTQSSPYAHTKQITKATNAGLQVGIMGDYNAGGVRNSQTGAGSGDHFDISIRAGGAGKGSNPMAITDRFMVSGGVSLTDSIKKHPLGDAQKHGAKRSYGGHLGIDIDTRHGRELYINPQYQVTDVKLGKSSKNDRHTGYGNYADVTFSNGLVVRIGHMDDAGAKALKALYGNNNGTNTTTQKLPTNTVTPIKTTKQYQSSAKLADKNTYDNLMTSIYSQYGFTPSEQAVLKAQVAAESNYNPNAVSPKKAFGLTQFMPATALQYNVKPNDIQSQLHGQAKYMKELVKKYNGNWDIALAAYNAGMGNVNKYGGKVPPFKETQDYVAKILANAPKMTINGKAVTQPNNENLIKNSTTQLALPLDNVEQVQSVPVQNEQVQDGQVQETKATDKPVEKQATTPANQEPSEHQKQLGEEIGKQMIKLFSTASPKQLQNIKDSIAVYEQSGGITSTQAKAFNTMLDTNEIVRQASQNIKPDKYGKTHNDVWHQLINGSYNSKNPMDNMLGLKDFMNVFARVAAGENVPELPRFISHFERLQQRLNNQANAVDKALQMGASPSNHLSIQQDASGNWEVVPRSQAKNPNSGYITGEGVYTKSVRDMANTVNLFGEKWLPLLNVQSTHNPKDISHLLPKQQNLNQNQNQNNSIPVKQPTVNQPKQTNGVQQEQIAKPNKEPTQSTDVSDKPVRNRNRKGYNNAQTQLFIGMGNKRENLNMLTHPDSNKRIKVGATGYLGNGYRVVENPDKKKFEVATQEERMENYLTQLKTVAKNSKFVEKLIKDKSKERVYSKYVDEHTEELLDYLLDNLPDDVASAKEFIQNLDYDVETKTASSQAIVQDEDTFYLDDETASDTQTDDDLDNIAKTKQQAKQENNQQTQEQSKEPVQENIVDDYDRNAISQAINKSKEAVIKKDSDDGLGEIRAEVQKQKQSAEPTNSAIEPELTLEEAVRLAKQESQEASDTTETAVDSADTFNELDEDSLTAEPVMGVDIVSDDIELTKSDKVGMLSLFKSMDKDTRNELLKKPVNNQNLAQLFFTQRPKRNLNQLPRFSHHLKNNPNKVLEILEQSKPSEEQKAQLEYYLGFEDNFKTSLMNTFASKNKGFEFEDLKQYFNVGTKSEPKFDDNLLSAMSVVVYDYMAVNGSKLYNTDKELRSILNLSEDAPIPAFAWSEYGKKGLPLEFVAHKLGKAITKQLDMVQYDDVPNESLARLQTSLGQWAIMSMVNADFVYLPMMNVNEHYENIALAGGSAPNQVDNKTNMYFVSFARHIQDKQGHYTTAVKEPEVSPAMRELQELSKNANHYVQTLFGVPSSKIKPKTKKPNWVKDKIAKSNAKLSKEQIKQIKKMQQAPMVLDTDVFESLTYLGRDFVLDMIGGTAITDEELSKLHITRQESEKAKREGIQRELDNALEWYDEIKDNEFYDTIDVKVNTRMHYASNLFNMQSSTLHRALGGYKQHQVEIATKDFKPDFSQKKGKLPITTYFLKAIAENAEGTENFIKEKLKGTEYETAGGTVDKLPAHIFMPIFWEYLQSDKVQSAIQALQNIRDEVDTPQDKKAVKELVAEWGMGMQSFKALNELTKFQLALETRIPFTAFIALGSDGVNNGTGISLPVLGSYDELTLKQVGIFLKDFAEQTYYDTRGKIKDYYEGLAPILEKVSKDIQANPLLTQREHSIFNAVNLTYKGFGRSLLKSMLVPFTYSAGLHSISESAFYHWVGELYGIIEKAANGNEKAIKQLDDLNKALTDVAVELKPELGYEIKGGELARLKEAYMLSMGEAIQTAMTEYASDLIEVRKLHTSAHTATSAVYINAYNQRLAQVTKNHQDKLRAKLKKEQPNASDKTIEKQVNFFSLTPEQIQKEVVEPLAPLFPKMDIVHSTNGEEQTRVELLERDLKLEYNSAVSTVNHYAPENKGLLSRVLPISVFTPSDAGLRPSSQIIQSIDANVSMYASAYAKNIALNNHDSNNIGLDNYVETVQEQNRRFFLATLNTHTGFNSIQPVIKSIRAISALEIDGVNKDSLLKDFWTNLAPATSQIKEQNLTGKELLKTYATMMLDRDLNKIALYEQVSNIQQYAGEGGEYTLTEKDRELIAKTKEDILRNKRQVLSLIDKLPENIGIPKLELAKNQIATNTEQIKATSGGAKGADTIWGELLSYVGTRIKHFKVKDIEAQVLSEAKRKGKELGVELTNDLHARNYLVVEKADAVYAVTAIKDGKVTGGTSTAVKLAYAMNKPIYVLDTTSVKWHTYEHGRLVEIDRPKLSKHPALIGARELEEGRKLSRSYQTIDATGNLSTEYEFIEIPPLSNTDDIKEEMLALVSSVGQSTINPQSQTQPTQQTTAPVQKELLGKTFTLADINKVMGNLNAHPALQELHQSLKELKVLQGVQLKFVNDLPESNNGAYVDGEIHISESYWHSATPNQKAKLLNHELIHAATVGVLFNDSFKNRQAVKDLKKMYRQLKDKADLTNPIHQAIFGLEDETSGIAELIAYGMTDAAIAKFIKQNLDLEQAKIKSKGVGRRFKQFLMAIANALGFIDGGMNYKAFVDKVNQVIKMNEDNNPDPNNPPKKPKLNSTQVDKFNPSETVQNQWEKDVDRISTSLVTFPNPITTATPPILERFTNFKGLKLSLTKSVIKKVGSQKDDGHSITIAHIKRLLPELYNPLAIMESKTQENALVVVTQMQLSGGQKVIAAIHLNKQDKNYEVNSIASIYGKDSFTAWFKQHLNENKLLYVDTKREQALLNTSSLQLRSEITRLVQEGIIQTSDTVFNPPTLYSTKEPTIQESIKQEVDKKSISELIKDVDKGDISDGFNQHLDNLADTLIKNFYNDTQKKAVKKDGSLKKIKVKNYQGSQKESILAEATYEVFNMFMVDNAGTQAVNQINKLYRNAKEQYKTVEALFTDYHTLNEVEQQKAKRIFNTVFNNKNEVNATALFMAMAITNERFATALNKGKVSRKQESDGWFDKVMKTLETLWDIITNKYYTKNAKTNLQEIYKYTAVMAKMENQLKTGEVNKLMRAYELGYNSVGMVLSVPFAGLRITNNYLANSNIPVLNDLASAIKGFSNANNEAIVGVLDKLNNIPKGELHNHAQELFNELTHHQDTGVWIDRLTRTTQYFAKLREQSSTATKKLLTENFKELSKKDRATLTHAVLKTDMASLIGNGYSVKEILALYNQDKRKKEMDKLENQLSNLIPDTKQYQDMLHQIHNLGYYLATGISAASLHKNSEMIAQSFGTKWEQELSSDVLKVVDTLVSLNALEFTKQDKLSGLDRLLQNEQDGMKALLEQAYAMNKQSKEEFKGNPLNYQKGYIPQINNPYVKVIWAIPSDIEKYKERGFEVVEELPQDTLDKTDKRIMMYHPNYTVANYVSGALDMLDSHARGTIIYDNLNNSADISRIANARLNQRYRRANTKPVRGQPPVTAHAMIATYGTDGEVLNYKYEMQDNTRDELLERNLDVIELMGTLSGQLTYRPLIRKQQQEVAKVMIKDATDNLKYNPSAFTFLDFESKDPKIVEMIRLLPHETYTALRQHYGNRPIPVRKGAFNALFGFKAYTIANIFDKIEDGQKANAAERFIYRALTGLFKSNARSYSVQFEKAVQALVAVIKDYIVIRSGRVLLGNIISNMQLLLVRGVNPYEIVAGTLFAWRNGKAYSKLQTRLAEIDTELRVTRDNKGKGELQRERQQVLKQLEQNPMHAFMQAGLQSTIVEDLNNADKVKFKSSLEKMIEKQTDKIPNSFKNAFNVATIGQGTALHNLLSEATQFSDFSAKYVLAKHEMNKAIKQGKIKEDAFNLGVWEAQKSFINYDIPTSMGLDYANRMGLMVFTKFFLRFQHALVKTFKEKPAQTLATHYLFESMGQQGILEPFVLNRLGNPIDMLGLQGVDAFGGIATVNMVF